MRFRLAQLGLTLLLVASPVRADYLYPADYTEAAQAVLARRYVDARTIAERMLEELPDSFEAEAVLGQVHLRGEEDLGLAQLHLTRARKLLEQRFPPPLGENAPRDLHREILRNLRQVALLREDYDQSLKLIAEYNALYDPDLDGLRGWPLMKLGRFPEAESAVKAAQAKLDEEDAGQVDLWDTLGQLAYEQGDSAQAEERFALASSLETDTADRPDPVYLTNLGEVQRDRLQFSEAEASWLEAVGWPHPGSYAEPHEHLASLYAGQGRFEEALNQLEQSVSWRAALWPQVAAHTRASHLTAVGEVLLAMGEAGRAVEVLERALASPNRQALSSGRTEVTLARRYLLYASALELAAGESWEERSWSRGQAWWRAGREAVQDELLAAWARSRAAVVLARSGGLEPALRAYGAGAMQCPWLLPQLARALGAGPTRSAVEQAPSVLSKAGPPGFSPGVSQEHQANSAPELGAYMSLLGSPVKGALPKEETLAGAVSLARSGRWMEALADDPLIARRERLSLGLKVNGPEALSAMLFASPRFHPGQELTLTVANDLSATLADAQGKVLVRVSASPDLASLARGLHHTLFARHLEWTAARLDALTREASPGRMASSRIEELLGGSP